MNELVDDMNMISRQVSRMSSIVNNIRDFARQESGATLVDVDVNKAIENVFSMLGRQLEAHNIHVRKELTWGIGHLRAQQTGLEQVIINLLVNAREALEECEHDGKEIWLRTGKLNGQIVIELGDNATGISESLGDRIFKPYLTTKDVGKGTGLGLSISRSIVAEMGGHIEYFNNEHGGTTFLATFPERRDW
jgi:histidine kinase